MRGTDTNPEPRSTYLLGGHRVSKRVYDTVKFLNEELSALRKERDTFKASYLEQVELHNLTLDELNRYRAVMEQAVEALEKAQDLLWNNDSKLQMSHGKINTAIDALREVLED